MDTVWVVYKDGYGSGSEEFGRTCFYPDHDAIKIICIFDNELDARRCCMETNNSFKCKSFPIQQNKRDM